MARESASRTFLDAVGESRAQPQLRWLSLHALSLAVAAAATLLYAPATIAQELSADPERAIRCFEESRRNGELSPDCPPDVVSAKTIVRSRERLSDVAYRATLEGLGRLAVASDFFQARIGAVILLASAGDVESEVPDPSVVDRLATIYRQSDDIHVRSLIARLMCCQAEVSQAVEFLQSVAREDRPEDRSTSWPPAHWALTTLETMGPPGRTALQELHTENSVKNPRARRFLEYISQHSFREPDHKQR